MKKFYSIIKKYHFLFLFLVYTLILVIYYYSGQIPIQNDYFTPDFIVGFRASLLEDIVFFSLIGLVVYISSFRSSEDENIDTRIASIINAELASTNSKAYFKEKIGEILSYYDSLNVTITVSDYKESDKALKIEAHFEGDIINMSKDLQLQTLIKAYAKPAKIINNTAGEIRFLQITDKTSSEKLLDISKSSQAIIPGKEFAVKKAIEIKPNGKVNYQFSFWIWSEIQDIDKLQFNEGFLFSADRFVNDLNITFLNNSGNALTAIVWREQEGNLGEKEIKSIFNSSNTETTNQSLYFPTTNLRRGERVSLGLAINKE